MEKLKEKKILSESLSKSQVSLNSQALSVASEGVAFVCCSVAVSGCNPQGATNYNVCTT